MGMLLSVCLLLLQAIIRILWLLHHLLFCWLLLVLLQLLLRWLRHDRDGLLLWFLVHWCRSSATARLALVVTVDITTSGAVVHRSAAGHVDNGQGSTWSQDILSCVHRDQAGPWRPPPSTCPRRWTVSSSVRVCVEIRCIIVPHSSLQQRF